MENFNFFLVGGRTGFDLLFALYIELFVYGMVKNQGIYTSSICKVSGLSENTAITVHFIIASKGSTEKLCYCPDPIHKISGGKWHP